MSTLSRGAARLEDIATTRSAFLSMRQAALPSGLRTMVHGRRPGGRGKGVVATWWLASLAKRAAAQGAGRSGMMCACSSSSKHRQMSGWPSWTPPQKNNSTMKNLSCVQDGDDGAVTERELRGLSPKTFPSASPKGWAGHARLPGLGHFGLEKRGAEDRGKCGRGPMAQTAPPCG